MSFVYYKDEKELTRDNFLFSCLCQDEQQLPEPRVRSEVARVSVSHMMPVSWGWIRDPARAKLPSTATLQQYSSDQTFHFLSHSQFQFQQDSVRLDLQYGM